ncbi:MAG: glycosyltransferase family 2 protein [Candidatus Woesearchaeota archaeon]|nr:MAG: glycosyltransferase family 2 protein [Candidatus Woesearchaeota archaeon]
MYLLTGIYLTLIFISMYFLFLFSLLFFRNRKEMFNDKKSTDFFPRISIVMPAYNEGKNIGRTLRKIRELEYPKDKLEVIVVDDGSTDRTSEIVKKFKEVRIIRHEKNSGYAAIPINTGIDAAKNEIVAIMNADSYPEKEALLYMVPYFKDKKTGAVTGAYLAKDPKTFLQKLQNFEYRIIAWNRKLLHFLNAVYVTPGPLSLYRKSVLLEVGKFDEKNLTEDIEIAWRILKYNYSVKMCLSAITYVETPDTLRKWWKQRTRWNIGGMQTLGKYKRFMFSRKYDMFGVFVIPLFLSFMIISVFGFSVISYIFTSKGLFLESTIIKHIATSSKIFPGELNILLPEMFVFFGLLMLIIGIALFYIAIKDFNKYSKYTKIASISGAAYNLVYHILFPLVFLHSIIRLVKKDRRW